MWTDWRDEWGDPPASPSLPSSLLWRFIRGDCVSLPPCSGILSSSSVPSVTHPGLMRLVLLSRASTETTTQISIQSWCIFLWRQGSAESGRICGLLYQTWQPQSCEELIAWDKAILFFLLHLGDGEEMGPIGLLAAFCSHHFILIRIRKTKTMPWPEESAWIFVRTESGQWVVTAERSKSFLAKVRWSSLFSSRGNWWRLIQWNFRKTILV